MFRLEALTVIETGEKRSLKECLKYVPHLNVKTNMGLKAVLRLLLILMPYESSLMQSVGTTHESCHMSLVTTMCLATDIDDQAIKITMLRM